MKNYQAPRSCFNRSNFAQWLQPFLKSTENISLMYKFICLPIIRNKFHAMIHIWQINNQILFNFFLNCLVSKISSISKTATIYVPTLLNLHINIHSGYLKIWFYMFNTHWLASRKVSSTPLTMVGLFRGRVFTKHSLTLILDMTRLAVIYIMKKLRFICIWHHKEMITNRYNENKNWLSFKSILQSVTAKLSTL